MIHSALAKKFPDQVAFVDITREAQLADSLEFVSFTRPSDVMVSRWFPGYRLADLTGKDADEAIGLLLASELKTADALEGFRRLLSSPDIAPNVINKLLPRVGVPVRTRNYIMSERQIRREVAAELARRSEASGAVAAAFAHVLVRALSNMGLVMPSQEQRMVATSASYVVAASDIDRVILTEAMRDMFSEARMASAMKALDQEVTPELLGEALAKLFRQASHVIPEVKLRLEELNIVRAVVLQYHIDPAGLRNAVSAHPALVSLASLANFMVYSNGEVMSEKATTAASVSEIKEACNNILQVLQSAPSIEMMPLSKFIEYFGEAPSASPEGLRRGAVIFAVHGQSSKMDVADARPGEGATELSLLSPEYVRASGIASPMNGSLLTPDAMAGLANVVADEMSLGSYTDAFNPRLVTLQVTEVDLVLLAMAKADSVGYVKDRTAGVSPVRLVFGCQVAEQWRMSVFAATPTMAFFLDPAAVVLYKSKMSMVMPKPLPSRAQTLNLSASNDLLFIGDVDQYLVPEVERSFRLSVPVRKVGGEVVELKLDIVALAALLGYDAAAYPERGGSRYVAIKEPGVDSELSLMLSIALEYAEAQDEIVADKAKSWLIEHLMPLITHPAVQHLAERALNAAIIEARIDARSLSPQFKEVVLRAYLGTALAILNRFGKIDGTQVTGISAVIPISGLSIKSQLAMASLAPQLNASHLTTK